MYATFRAGETSSSSCPRCRKIVSARYEYRTVQLARTRLRVRDVLVPVCPDCDHMIAIPRQSVAQLREVGVGK